MIPSLGPIGKLDMKSSDAETNKAIIAELSKKYPKFTKVQLSMIRNPEYGLQMASGALSDLRKAGILPDDENVPEKVKLRKRKETRRRVTIRFDNEDFDRLLGSKKEKETIQSFIEKIVKEYLDEHDSLSSCGNG